jgi:hypothetical protein
MAELAVQQETVVMAAMAFTTEAATADTAAMLTAVAAEM